MPEAFHTGSTPVPAMPNPSRRYLLYAWIAVALIPVMFVLGTVIGEGLQAMQGHGSGGDGAVPMGAKLLAAVPTIIVLLLPVVPAVGFGLMARRMGSGGGLVPAVIGIAYAAWSLLTNGVGLLVGGV